MAVTTSFTTAAGSDSMITGVGRRRRARAVTVAGAVVVTSVLFLAGRAAGADVTLTDPNGVSHAFRLIEISVATAMFGLLGWGTLALLERFTRHAARIWLVLAAFVVALSIVPIFVESGNAPTRALLITLHCVVGLTLLPLVRRGR